MAELQQPQQSKQPKKRIALWDNARFLLIALVVIGHMISKVRTESAVAFGVYAYIYLFHMPAMIFLSGYFSQVRVSTKGVTATVQLVVVWLIWEGIWALTHFFIEGKGTADSFLVVPAWSLWFLVSLVTMRMLLPYFARLRHPLLIAVLIAVGTGLLPDIGTPFSASRTASFLPFFVLGWQLRVRGTFKSDWFERPTWKLRTLGAGILAAVAAAFLLAPNLRTTWRVDEWLTWRDDDAELLAAAPIADAQAPVELLGMVMGMSITLLLLLVGAAMTFAVLCIAPRRASFITAWGTRTLYVYLLHGPIVWCARHFGWIDEANALGGWGLTLLVVAALALTALLSLKVVQRITWPVIEPPVGWLIRRPRTQPKRPRQVKTLPSE